MRRGNGLWEVPALANHHRADKCGGSSGCVHDDTTGEIHNAPSRHDAAAPDPMGNRCIDNQQPDGRE